MYELQLAFYFFFSRWFYIDLLISCKLVFFFYLLSCRNTKTVNIHLGQITVSNWEVLSKSHKKYVCSFYLLRLFRKLSETLSKEMAFFYFVVLLNFFKEVSFPSIKSDHHVHVQCNGNLFDMIVHKNLRRKKKATITLQFICMRLFVVFHVIYFIIR